jgi:DNA polymerase I-like protein with 3'-5' exonuclease and polymerase domains
MKCGDIRKIKDEVVFEVPADQEEAYTATIGKVMTECAEHFLRPFGVKGECSPTVGKTWLKD